MPINSNRWWAVSHAYNRVSFRKMGKGGQNNTYKINGGAKGVHAIVRLLEGLGHNQISAAHLQDYLFWGESISITVSICNVQL